MEVRGHIFFQPRRGVAKRAGTQDRKSQVGYVTQTDFLLPFLTARETLGYAAELRLPHTIPREERHRRVDDVIMELGLKECADTLVGNEHARGISGGEKRRVSVGVQILTDPPVLCADEPSSGLDAFTAHNVVETLRKLALSGKSVICSIHQPRSDVFAMFDSCLLLSRSQPTFCGPMAAMEGHFAALGFPCPPNTNLADYVVDISSVDPRTPADEAEGMKRVATLALAYRQREDAAPALAGVGVGAGGDVAWSSSGAGVDGAAASASAMADRPRAWWPYQVTDN